MAKVRKSVLHGGFSAAALCAAATGLIALPSAGFALGRIAASTPAADLGIFTPASVDPRLAKLVAETTSNGTLMRFTPAGAANHVGRPVTVAVRVDEGAAQLVSVHSALAAGANDLTSEKPAAAIAPTRYSLGVARGYQSFAKPAEVAGGLTKDVSSAALPDLAKFAPAPEPAGKPSRFAARITPDEQERTARPPRSLESLGDQAFELGGSYRVTRNLDFTAGVRYSQDQDRLAPLTNGKQDSQAVYVGTQFRF
jgi:hypothetical protein